MRDRGCGEPGLRWRVTALVAALLALVNASDARAGGAFSLGLPRAFEGSGRSGVFESAAAVTQETQSPPWVALQSVPELEGDLATPRDFEKGRSAAGLLRDDFRALLHVPLELDSKDWSHFGLAAATVGVVALFDKTLQGRVNDGTADGGDRASRLLRPLGQEGGIALVGLSYLAGRVFHKPGWEHAARDAAEASLISGIVVVPALKWIVGRTRPRDGAQATDFHFFSGASSFPSGEAAQVFTLAAVYSGHTENRWAKALLWTTAAVVSAQRVEANAHWASDVVAGAIVGASIGRWVVHRHRSDQEVESCFTFAPLVVHGGGGLTFHASWK